MCDDSVEFSSPYGAETIIFLLLFSAEEMEALGNLSNLFKLGQLEGVGATFKFKPPGFTLRSESVKERLPWCLPDSLHPEEHPSLLEYESLGFVDLRIVCLVPMPLSREESVQWGEVSGVEWRQCWDRAGTIIHFSPSPSSHTHRDAFPVWWDFLLQVGFQCSCFSSLTFLPTVRNK